MNKSKVYQQLLNDYNGKYQKIKQELKWISIARLLAFGLIIFSTIYFWHSGVKIVAPIDILLLSIFLFWIKKYNTKEKEKNFYKNLIEINEDELKALTGDFSHFKDGKEFIDIQHSFSYDLDLFGVCSFFQFINRTCTQRGQKRLASFLGSCKTNSELIQQKQKAIKELENEIDWRQHFAAKGKTEADQQDFDIISQWSATSFQLKNEKIISILIKLLPAITILAIVLNILSIISWGVVLILFLAQWVIFGSSIKTIQHFQQQFSSRSDILSKYIEMLHDIENKKFQSSHLQSVKQNLYFKNKPASQISKKLTRLINELDFSQNIIMAFILNSIFLWNIRCIYRLSQWHRKHHHLLDQWFETIAEFDALSSFGNFNYNHEKWAVPIPRDNSFIFDAEELGHPLIDENKRINNNFKLDGDGKLTIITGANMAGKSTFLRTIGINLVLAMNGCKVCAQKMQFTPISLYTNMRTTDNLMNDESYFYAELLRLQQLLERLRAGEKLFVIIDEMLKGTNSVDKLNGSRELVKQLLSLKASGIVATHDLKLTELAEDFPAAIQNQCFEVQLTEKDLAFDYKLRKGVTQTMNATFLMKKMGIIK